MIPDSGAFEVERYSDTLGGKTWRVQIYRAKKSSIFGLRMIVSFSQGKIRAEIGVLVLATEMLVLGKDPSSRNDFLWSQGLGQFHVFSKFIEEIAEISAIAQLDGEE